MSTPSPVATLPPATPLLSPRATLALRTLRRLACTRAEARSTAATLRARATTAPLSPDDEAVIEACDVIAGEQGEEQSYKNGEEIDPWDADAGPIGLSA